VLVAVDMDSIKECKCGHDINEHGGDDPRENMVCDYQDCDCVEYEEIKS
jgi:hypothetical protein